jgi:hypothetical protein
MTDDPEIPEGFDWQRLFSDFRKSASVKAGAAMFGEAQIAYYDTLKNSMTEEMAYNMLAHTTEQVIKGIATAAGPVASAILQAAAIWEKMMPQTDKEVPGGSS